MARARVTALWLVRAGCAVSDRAGVPWCAPGVAAPLCFYVTENADGSTLLSYREPSAVFAPYGVAQSDALAGELDAIFGEIAAQAIAP